MSAGDDAREAYTAIAWGVLLSHEMGLPQGRRPWKESNATWAMPLCEASFTLPGSENTSRAKGSRRNLGDLVSPAIAKAVPGHGRKPRRHSCRGRGEESDGCIVPGKRRTMLSGQQQRRWWREGGQSKERREATHVPDTEPGEACH